MKLPLNLVAMLTKSTGGTYFAPFDKLGKRNIERRVCLSLQRCTRFNGRRSKTPYAAPNT
jgi:hypothetical protein